MNLSRGLKGISDSTDRLSTEDNKKEPRKENTVTINS